MPIDSIGRISASALLAFLLLGATGLADGATLAPSDAINFVGQIATVCGRVASAKYAVDANGQPTFLNLDKPYPRHVFTAIVWGRNRGAFPYAPESLEDRQICATGLIKEYNGRAEMTVAAATQVQLK
jgi:hypothetical protein